MRLFLSLSGILFTLTSCGKLQNGNADTSSIVSFDAAPFVGGKDGYKVYRAPTMVISQKGTLLAFAEGRVNGAADEGDIDVVLKRSKDNGRSWETIQVLENDGANPCKNQSPVVLPSGRILLVWNWNKSIPNEGDRTTREVFVTFSDDDGKTWSKSRNITSSVSEPNWGWSGMGPVHGIVKRSAPNKGRVVLAARHNTDETNMVSHVIYSDDNGETWHLGGSVSRQRTSESTVVELSNGDIMLNSRNQTGDENYRVVSISKDGGLSFSKTWLETQLVEPRGVQGSLLFYGMNKTTGKGNILFSNPNNEKSRSDGTIKLSSDDGITWSEAAIYAPKPAPYFTGYSDMVVMPDGNIGVLYERGDVNPNDSKKERYVEVGFSIVRADSFSALNGGKPDPADGNSDPEKKRCLIKGGAGRELFRDHTTKDRCKSKCDDFDRSNPHRECVWGDEKLRTR